MNKAVVIDYTNHRGERRRRMIRPREDGLTFAHNEYHPGAQWVLWAYDVEREGEPLRCFAMSSIHAWEPVRD